MMRAAYFTGQLLLAMPGIGDPRFRRAAIAIVSHDAMGAMGIGLTRETTLTVSEMLDQSGIAGTVTPDPFVIDGGPVERQRGFVVHSRDWGGEGTVDVVSHGDARSSGSFAVSGALDVLRAIGAGTGPTVWQIALGYAGWSAGQLETEIAEAAWHVTGFDLAVLAQIPPDERWRTVLARDGIDPARIAVRGGTA